MNKKLSFVKSQKVKTKSYSPCIVLVLVISVFSLFSCKEKQSSFDIYKEADKIVQSIVIPQFPDDDFIITDYGGIGDGNTKNTEAFKKAIEACAESGGGRVIVPKGEYLTGPIHLKSNVELHLEEGSHILFSKDKDDYLPVVRTAYEGMEFMNYSPLIYAYKQKNIAVTGKGVLDGQASNKNWWPWSGAERYGYKEGEPTHGDEHNHATLQRMVDHRIPVEERIFGEGHQFRPTFFEPFDSRNILLKDVTFINSPFWVIHPFRSENITIDGVTIDSHGPNNDGCDPEYSKNVHIKNNVFNTGDDCIAIKSGRDEDGRRVGIPSENIVIENNEMKDGHGGVVIGSEISAGVKNVYAINNKMDSPQLDRAIRIKTNTRRGGHIENIFVKGLQVGEVREATLKINTRYAIHADQEGEHQPIIRNVRLENIEVEDSGKYGVLIQGREESIIENILLENVQIKKVEEPVSAEYVDNLEFINSEINGIKFSKGLK